MQAKLFVLILWGSKMRRSRIFSIVSTFSQFLSPQNGQLRNVFVETLKKSFSNRDGAQNGGGQWRPIL